MEKKTFIGSGRSKSPKWLKATIPEKALHIMLENLQEYQGNKFAKIDINILPEPNKFGKDVELTLDTWTPSGDRTQTVSAPPEQRGDTKLSQQGGDADKSGDMPF